MSRIPDIDDILPEGYAEDLRNHYDDGYTFGREDERNRILTIIELDLMTSEEIKQRLKELIYGGKDNVPKP